jgi:DNA (cytosine-5)-methyltransferase 1
MFPQAVRAVREIRPKAFILENVKGLLRRNFANYYSYIVHQLRFPELTPRGDEEWQDHLARLEQAFTSGKHTGLRYNVVFQLLNSADYGVPQRRERVLIVGIRADLGLKFSFPLASHGEEALLHQKWVTGEYWARHQIAKHNRPELPDRLRLRVEGLRELWPDVAGRPWQTVRDAIRDLPAIAMGETSNEIANHYYNPGARSYAGHTGSALDEPAKTLKAGDHGVPGGENTVLLDDGSIRYFSVRECARVQTFPDDWFFEGSWTESMRQLGNAVPVKLAQVVATQLARVLVKGEVVRREATAFTRAASR